MDLLAIVEFNGVYVLENLPQVGLNSGWLFSLREDF
jgi:hypothetical protein